MKATLTIDRVPGPRATVQHLVIDCPHGTTTIITVAGAVPISDDAVLQVALARHRAEQPHCRCIRHLERRFGAHSTRNTEAHL